MERLNSSGKPALPPGYRPSPPASQPQLAAPSAYRPRPLAQQMKPAAPPVYRPNQTSPQMKPAAPPVYRPNQTSPQMKPAAPPVYRPAHSGGQAPSPYRPLGHGLQQKRPPIPNVGGVRPLQRKIGVSSPLANPPVGIPTHNTAGRAQTATGRSIIQRMDTSVEEKVTVQPPT